jgi:hypothetical protein
MRALDIKSYNTVKRLQKDGIIEPFMIGRNKKWDIEQCLLSVAKKSRKNEKAAV